MIKKIKIKKSLEYWKNAQRLIPCGTMTMSKGPQYYVFGASPIYLQRGKGSHVWDVDNNEYIDYVLALGPIVLGYNYPSVNKSVIQQLEEGITFSLMHPLETVLADKLCELVPCAQQVIFLKTGSEAASAAIRIARSYTGRAMIACCGYHGWHDWYIGTTTRNSGIPSSVIKLTLTFRYNDFESVRKIFKEYPNKIAAIIMEPVGIEEPKDNFLQKVKSLANKYGALLIFDEIITGFRLNLGGAQAYFNIIPDIACFGKAMANGFPIAAVVGNKKVMQVCRKAFISSTFGGEVIAIRAALATIDELKNKNVCDYIFKMGKELRDRFNLLAERLKVDARMIGLPHKTVCVFKDRGGHLSQLYKSLFLQEVLARGAIIGNGQFISFSHSQEDIEKTLIACEESLNILKYAIDKDKVTSLLRGRISEEVFRKP